MKAGFAATTGTKNVIRASVAKTTNAVSTKSFTLCRIAPRFLKDVCERAGKAAAPVAAKRQQTQAELFIQFARESRHGRGGAVEQVVELENGARRGRDV